VSKNMRFATHSAVRKVLDHRTALSFFALSRLEQKNKSSHSAHFALAPTYPPASSSIRHNFLRTSGNYGFFQLPPSKKACVPKGVCGRIPKWLEASRLEPAHPNLITTYPFCGFPIMAIVINSSKSYGTSFRLVLDTSLNVSGCSIFFSFLSEGVSYV